MKAAEAPAEKLAVAQAHADKSVSALYVLLAAYLAFGAMTWFVYLRRSFATDRSPSLASRPVPVPGGDAVRVSFRVRRGTIKTATFGAKLG